MAVLRLVAVLALFTVSEAQASSMGAPRIVGASVLAQPAPDSSVAPPPPPGERQMPTELQVGQSRFGLWVNEKGTLRGQVEVDFADFTKATPTVQAVPRLRIARVDWVPAPGHTLSFGQDWQHRLHAPAAQVPSHAGRL